MPAAVVLLDFMKGYKLSNKHMGELTTYTLNAAFIDEDEKKINFWITKLPSM